MYCNMFFAYQWNNIFVNCSAFVKWPRAKRNMQVKMKLWIMSFPQAGRILTEKRPGFDQGSLRCLHLLWHKTCISLPFLPEVQTKAVGARTLFLSCVLACIPCSFLELLYVRFTWQALGKPHRPSKCLCFMLQGKSEICVEKVSFLGRARLEKFERFPGHGFPIAEIAWQVRHFDASGCLGTTSVVAGAMQTGSMTSAVSLIGVFGHLAWRKTTCCSSRCRKHPKYRSFWKHSSIRLHKIA